LPDINERADFTSSVSALIRSWLDPERLTAVQGALRLSAMRIAALCLLACAVLPPLSRAQAPVFMIAPEKSTIRFYVKSSVDIEGHFDKWGATLTFTSPKISTAVLDIKIQASSVDTGSGFKDDKLKSKDFFDVRKDPVITFKSTKIVRTSPTTYQVQGNFTIRGVTKTDILTLTADTEGKGIGEVKGTMAFDRKDYGMDGSIPFIKIADRVEVTISLQAKRVGGPPVMFEQ
jgi:polyisoprenoid-binding protein YceI